MTHNHQTVMIPQMYKTFWDNFEEFGTCLIQLFLYWLDTVEFNPCMTNYFWLLLTCNVFVVQSFLL